MRDPLVTTPTEGEITSDWFPAGGTTLNTKDPWRQLSVPGAVVTLTDGTHGQRGQGTCRFPEDVDVNWTIATAAPRSFAGNWSLEVATSRDWNGVNFYLEGPRVGGAPGVIQNIASNRNQPTEMRDPSGANAWFQIEFTNTRLGLGSRSSPDGLGTLADLPDSAPAGRRRTSHNRAFPRRGATHCGRARLPG